MKLPITLAERIGIALASLALSVGLIAALSGFFAGRDQAGVASSGAGPGQAFRDLGDVHLAPGTLRPPYDSDPPTSGAHVAEPIQHDDAELSDDQLLSALELGDVVIMYGGANPPQGLPGLQTDVASRFTPQLAAAGEAVILARRPGTHGLIALAWAHMLRSTSARNPLLRQFATFWLGRGAQGR